MDARPGPSGCQHSNEIDIHNNLKNHLYEWLNNDQLKQLIEQFRENPLSKREIQLRITDVFDLFDCLMEHETIAVGDYKALVQKLKRIHRRLATHVENEEKKIRDIQNGGPSPVKLAGPSPVKLRRTGNPSIIDVPTANTSHALKIHPNLQPMIDTTKARVTEEIKKSFIDTQAFRDGKEKLQKNRIAVLKGNTGDGKTSTAIQLLHWLSQEQHNRQPVQLHNIKDLDLLAPSSKTVIFIDDIFGEKDLRKKEVQEWNKRVNSVIPRLCGDDQTEANFILITVRNEIFNSLKTHSLADVFTDVNIVDLSADTYKVTEEKNKLLELYKPSEFSWEKEEKEEIVKCAPNIGFPQCCRIFRDVPEVQKERVKFFQSPFIFSNQHCQD
ncbi:uncharacterized protein LOC117318882 isoform X2 [Pecten maximus]|uniref:uncharacterized protein LOC117318882 isoform X2 n=1 Tax=Pecten maximus TaxID=6579 RepID=UPI001457F83D|nr:uncharacterized protein LOC117318882 isoform X2 [Pecten maximus]